MTQTVGKHTLKKLRTKYETWVGKAWPHDDKFLKELWLEARETNDQGLSRKIKSETWSFALDLMRENHE